AFWAGMSAEIATSPANPFAARCAGGNDNTSVGVSLPRKRWFRLRNSRLVVTSTVTLPRSPALRLARVTKRSSVSSVNPGTRFCRMTMRHLIVSYDLTFDPETHKEKTGGQSPPPAFPRPVIPRRETTSRPSPPKSPHSSLPKSGAHRLLACRLPAVPPPCLQA